MYRIQIKRNLKNKKKIVIIKEYNTKPGYLSPQYVGLKKKFKDFDSIQVCQYNPHLGLIPIEISDIFPAAHHETARLDFNPEEFTVFEKTWKDFFSNNKFLEVHYDKDDKFLKYFVKMLPKKIKQKSFS